MGLWAKILAGGAAGGFKAAGEIADENIKETKKRGFLAEEVEANKGLAEHQSTLRTKETEAAEGRKDYAIGKDGVTVLSRAEYQKLSPDERMNYVPATAAEAQLAADKAALDERRAGAAEEQASAAGRRADAAEKSAEAAMYRAEHPQGNKGRTLPAAVDEGLWKRAEKQAKDELGGGFLGFGGGDIAEINKRTMEIYRGLYNEATVGSDKAPEEETQGKPSAADAIIDLEIQANGESHVAPSQMDTVPSHGQQKGFAAPEEIPEAKVEKPGDQSSTSPSQRYLEVSSSGEASAEEPAAQDDYWTTSSDPAAALYQAGLQAYQKIKGKINNKQRKAYERLLEKQKSGQPLARWEEIELENLRNSVGTV